MKRSDFYYDLPEELIAQHPAEPRDSSRLLVLDAESGEIEHTVFREIGKFLKKGDLLVVNNTKVIPARLYGYKEERKTADICRDRAQGARGRKVRAADEV